MKNKLQLLACLVTMVFLLSCANPDGTAEKAAPSKEPENIVDVSTLTEEIPEIKGPKRTIAVGKFASIGSFDTKYGDWDVGGGLGAMLTTALVEADRFVVVERTNVERVLSEQQMAGNKVTTGTTQPELGKMIGVQYMLFGAVTEFGEADEGGGFSLGFGSSADKLDDLFTGAVSTESASGAVAMDIRVVDTTSGRIIEVIRVKEPIDSSGWDVSLGYEEMNIGTNQFKKTPLGEASRRAITKVVSRLALTTMNKPWSGMVVDFDGETTIINAGSSAGIRVGDLFMAETIVKKLTDPATGEVLTVRKKKLGTIEITEVEEKVAIGSFLPLSMEVPQRGDLVMELKKKSAI